MASLYRLFGHELSPYSVKVRAYFRFKGLAHEWIVRSAHTEEEFQKHAKLPLIPLVVTPSGEALQDSTPIIEALEAQFSEPSIVPEDPRLAFLSALIEEYADEWVNKPMFHYRWQYPADAEAAAAKLAATMMPDADPATAIAMIRDRMVRRLSFVGSSDATREVIEGSYTRLLELLENLLRDRPYLFGKRPSLADFGLFGQLYECSTDPTPGALLRQKAPSVLAWIERMQSPRVEGAWESFSVLAPALVPLLRDEIGTTFVPWTVANEQALRAGNNEFEVEILGQRFVQAPQKYHAKSLNVLRQRFARPPQAPDLLELLERTSCLGFLQTSAS